jgi:hypothetical protein
MTKLTVYQYPMEKVIVIEERDTEKEWHTLSGSSRAPFYM